MIFKIAPQSHNLTKCRRCKLPPPFQVDDGYRAECTSLALSLPRRTYELIWSLPVEAETAHAKIYVQEQVARQRFSALK